MKRGKPLRRVGARAKRQQEDLDAGRQAALLRADGRCERCGYRRYAEKLHVHHIVSRARAPGWGGLHAPENLAVLCHPCHRFVHDNPATETRWIRSKPR